MRVEFRPRGGIVSLLLLLALLLPFRALAAEAPASSPFPENPIGGSSVFVEKKCLYCHSIQGYGGVEGPDLGRLKLSGGFLGMAGFMWNHAPKMLTVLAKDKLPFPRFTTEEMRQLVAFLYTLNYLDPPGDARRGEEVFTAKRCIACHRVGGVGGSGGPPLDKYGSFISPVFVATGLWDKGPTMAKEMERKRIPWPDLSGRDVRDIVAFIRARAGRLPGRPSRVFVRPGNPTKGASLFKSKGCANCHTLGSSREEDIWWRKGGPPLAVRELKVSLSTIASRMWNHSPSMWAILKTKGMSPISLTPEEMADVTAYLYFLQFESAPGDPSRGVHIFINNGCANCHSPGQGKSPIGPDLRYKGPWSSDIDLAREMWNHAGNMYGTLLGTAREWPKLGEKDVADLLAYVRSIGGTGKKAKRRN